MSTLLFIGGVLVMIVAVAASIALHEIGHLLPAKKFGLRVPQYMIGFGKTLFSFRRGETEYGVKAIPLGGYVSMVGMYPPQAARRQKEGKPSFLNRTFGQLIDDARSQANEQVKVQDEGRMFYQLPIYKRIIIMLGGPLMNLLIAFVMIGIVVTGFGVSTATTTVSEVYRCMATAERSDVTECTPGDQPAPAYAAGLRPGDTITAVNGQAVANDAWYELTGVIRENPGQSVALEYNRDGTSHSTTLTPYLTERPVLDDQGYVVTGENGQALMENVGFVGMASELQNLQQPVSAVPGVVGDQLVRIGNVILHLPQRMADVARAAFGTEERDPNGPVSVVGVGRIAGEINASDQLGMTDKVASLISLIGGLNLALFAFNLIPLLPLDGGHVAGALFEGIKRFFARLTGRKDVAPVDTLKLLPLTYVVVVAMMVMGGLLIYADIFKPIQIF
ncbi:site-2 protease family protein [Glutamicibacter sp. MNS18]|uniref:M50 family metallopeptidase n=1 Tax=Glutamicibacter sp. MNS18 TaxID=2989817 RepID=UPI0022357F9E|nr:site-2 protease family protein [Glutamicibacter sp. MNS18]MCW4465242.1 site-2 protease family protein [Glutamicibacter sp. MNS18]